MSKPPTETLGIVTPDAPPPPLPLDLPVLLGEVTDAVSVQDRSGSLIFANAAAARASGFDSVEQMLAAEPGVFLDRFELFDEHGAPFPFARLPGRRALEGEPGTQVTLRFRRRDDGQERWSVIHALPILAPDGEVRAVVNVIKDITAQKRSEAALRESETRFRAMADTAPVLIWVAETDGRCSFFNRPWLEFTGRTMEQEVGDGWTGGLHPDDRERCINVYLEALEARREFQMEYRLRRGDGEFRWILDHGVPRFSPDGGFVGYIGSCIDITERRRGEEGLRFLARASAMLSESMEVESRLSSLTRLAVPELADWCAVDLLDGDGVLQRLSVAHRDPAKVAWAFDAHRRYPPDPDATSGGYHALRTGRAEMFPEITDEMLVRTAIDAEHLEVLRAVGFSSAIVAPLTARGRPLGVIAFVAAESGRRYDEVDLHLAEDLARRAATAIDNARLFEDLARSREELEAQTTRLGHLAAELEAANAALLQRTDDAETANRAKAEFLAMMSHELRTPLNAIAGYVDLLLAGVRGPLTERQRLDLERIQRSETHLLGIINELLNFARIESGHVEFAIDDVRLAPLLAGICELVELQLDQRGIAYRCAQPGPDVTVRADRERVRQILLNLIGNAIKFTPPGGRIEVGCHEAGDTVEIRVEDTGRGIPADRLRTIFEPFVQVDATLTRDADGIGLGLAISRELARAMQGDIRVTSEVGVGSTFVLTLPRGGGGNG